MQHVHNWVHDLPTVHFQLPFFWFNHAYCNTGFNMGWRYHYVMSQDLENAHQLQLQPGIATTETCYPCSQIDLTACMVIDNMEGINCSIKRLTGFLSSETQCATKW